MAKPLASESPEQSGAFRTYIAEKGLRATRQRMAVFEAARTLPGHYTAEDLLKKARSLDRSKGSRPSDRSAMRRLQRSRGERSK